MKLKSKYKHFFLRKCIWKCGLQNHSYFVQASMTSFHFVRWWFNIKPDVHETHHMKNIVIMKWKKLSNRKKRLLTLNFSELWKVFHDLEKKHMATPENVAEGILKDIIWIINQPFMHPFIEGNPTDPNVFMMQDKFQERNEVLPASQHFH